MLYRIQDENNRTYGTVAINRNNESYREEPTGWSDNINVEEEYGDYVITIKEKDSEIDIINFISKMFNVKRNQSVNILNYYFRHDRNTNFYDFLSNIKIIKNYNNVNILRQNTNKIKYNYYLNGGNPFFVVFNFNEIKDLLEVEE